MKARKAGPDLSYIMSLHNRPKLLPVALYAIACQTHQNFEVIVTDNTADDRIAKQQRRTVENLKDPRFRYIRTYRKLACNDCYWSAEYAVEHYATGTWYHFICEDTYIVPEFGARMLAAAYRNGWDFVICGQAIIGPEGCGRSGYQVWENSPGKAPKTTFIVRASVFEGFAGKPNIPLAAAADYAFTNDMAKLLGPQRWGIVPHCMVVHN